MTRSVRFAVVASFMVSLGACGDGVEADADETALVLQAEEQSSNEQWIVLFDGESLNGWEARPTSNPDTSGDWTVGDGAMICGGTVPSWIHTNDEFSDFRLTLDFRGADSVNSGIFLRSQKEGQPHRTGYELQVWDHQPNGYNTGSLVDYVVAPPAPGIRPDVWNTYDITVVGDHFVAVLNGDTILDDRDATHAEGVIGLQCQPNNPIEFRNLRVLPLN